MKTKYTFEELNQIVQDGGTVIIEVDGGRHYDGGQDYFLKRFEGIGDGAGLTDVAAVVEGEDDDVWLDEISGIYVAELVGASLSL